MAFSKVHIAYILAYFDQNQSRILEPPRCPFPETAGARSRISEIFSWPKALQKLTLRYASSTLAKGELHHCLDFLVKFTEESDEQRLIKRLYALLNDCIVDALCVSVPVEGSEISYSMCSTVVGRFIASA